MQRDLCSEVWAARGDKSAERTARVGSPQLHIKSLHEARIGKAEKGKEDRAWQGTKKKNENLGSRSQSIFVGPEHIQRKDRERLKTCFAAHWEVG